MKSLQSVLEDSFAKNKVIEIKESNSDKFVAKLFSNNATSVKYGMDELLKFVKKYKLNRVTTPFQMRDSDNYFVEIINDSKGSISIDDIDFSQLNIYKKRPNGRWWMISIVETPNNWSKGGFIYMDDNNWGGTRQNIGKFGNNYIYEVIGNMSDLSNVFEPIMHNVYNNGPRY